MSKIIAICIVLFTLLSFFILPTTSQQNSTDVKSKAEGPVPSLEEQFRALFEEVDTDSDGGISPAEALAFWKEKVKIMDPGELKKRLDKYSAKSLEEAVERGFKKVDKDSNGRVSLEELKAYMTSD